jgi:hypothetical protein
MAVPSRGAGHGQLETRQERFPDQFYWPFLQQISSRLPLGSSKKTA